MHDWMRRMAAGMLMAAVSVLSNAGVLSVFGADTDATSLRRLDGSLRALSAAGPSHNLNPALHLRLAAPFVSPEVLVDVTAGSDAQTLQQALAGLGMRDMARALNVVGGWLPVTALAQAAQLPGLSQIRASMPRTRAASGPVALQGDFVQGSSALRTQYPGLTGTGLTIGLLSDSFNCYNYYAANGPSVLGNGYNGYATNGRHGSDRHHQRCAPGGRRYRGGGELRQLRGAPTAALRR